jgi:hypothetical protein
MASYKGVCVYHLGKSVINSVRVQLPDGSETEIPPARYIQQQVQPPLKSLPDCRAKDK